MKHHAVFIGVDRHADPEIPELTGARRDALALWAAFMDSVDGLEGVRLTDEAATGEAIRSALDSTLGAAGPEDTVIVTYSGHGSPDHRLIPFDTQVDALEATAISMAELAERFAATRARAVLCVLDCCYSGGAPARVLEAPVPRAFGDTVRMLEGKGRFIIAASNVNEPAWEVGGHGLLTRALLDVLSVGEGAINLQAAMAQVMDTVRAEAARIGRQQTPVCWNHVEGGLTLPVLRKGEHHREAFPEAAGLRVGEALDGLAAFGIAPSLIAAWKSRFPTLNALQLAAVNDQRVLDGESLLVVAPTSSGKTFIGELAAARAVLTGRKAVFLLPYKALVNEKFDEFSALYGEALGLRVIRCSGDYSDQTGELVRGRYDFAFLTYETFLPLAIGNPGVLERIGLVVLDEAQFVTDPDRGVNVELLLTYLITARAGGIQPQVVALSAVIGEVNDFDGWLGCKLLLSEERPVPLVEGVLDRTGEFAYVDPETGDARTEPLLSRMEVRQRRDKPSSQDVIVPLVRKLVAQGEKVIVFRNQKGTAQGCANYLAADLQLPPAEAVLEQLPALDLPSTSAALRKALSGGTAFHTANLTREERVLVESAFRDPEGPVRVLAATTGVAAGINTPASTVIIAEQEFLGENLRPFTVAEYKNMAGRAGRLGYNERGKCIILADNASQREMLFRRYVLGRPEPLRSSFDPRAPETWVVRLLAQVQRVRRDEVPVLLANTYGGYLAARRNPVWVTSVAPMLNQLVDRMIHLGLIETEQDYVSLTLLGRVCGSSHLSFESALRLVELLRESDPTQLDAERLMAILQVLPEADGGYTPLMKRGQSESVRIQDVSQQYGPGVARALQRLAQDMHQYWARCKRAAILWDWIKGVPVERIEANYSPTPFQGVIGYSDIRRFADVTRFHLRSAHQIASVLFPGQGADAQAVEKLLKRLEVGLPEDALPLLALPVPLARGQYLALYRNGAKLPEDAWALDDDQLKGLLGNDAARRLARLRPAEARSEAAIPASG